MKDYFIHTIGIQTYLTDVQLDSLCRAYDGVKNENNDPVCYFDQTEKKRVFSKYAHMGFRMKIDFANPTVKKFDSRKRKYTAEWIVTPAKLLYHGQSMVKSFSIEEYVKACAVLKEILDEIKRDSGVDLLDEAKLYRVDVTKDIESPSDAFTQEVIRLAKKSLDQRGYQLADSVTEEKRNKK